MTQRRGVRGAIGKPEPIDLLEWLQPSNCETRKVRKAHHKEGRVPLPGLQGGEDWLSGPPGRPHQRQVHLLPDITSPRGCVSDAAPGTRKCAPRHPQSTLSSGRFVSVSAEGNRL